MALINWNDYIQVRKISATIFKFLTFDICINWRFLVAVRICNYKLVAALLKRNILCQCYIHGQFGSKTSKNSNICNWFTAQSMLELGSYDYSTIRKAFDKLRNVAETAKKETSTLCHLLMTVNNFSANAINNIIPNALRLCVGCKWKILNKFIQDI